MNVCLDVGFDTWIFMDAENMMLQSWDLNLTSVIENVLNTKSIIDCTLENVLRNQTCLFIYYILLF